MQKSNVIFEEIYWFNEQWRPYMGAKGALAPLFFFFALFENFFYFKIFFLIKSSSDNTYVFDL
jgi:hypothetical protein